MGLFDLLRPRRDSVEVTRSALEQADQTGDGDGGAVTALITSMQCLRAAARTFSISGMTSS